jgi:hypothetical protein
MCQSVSFLAAANLVLNWFFEMIGGINGGEMPLKLSTFLFAF